MTDAELGVREDIKATKSHMSEAMTALERKMDVAQRIRENPWPALAIAFGAGLVLSASGAGERAGKAGAEAARFTGGKVGSAFQDMLGKALGGIAMSVRSHVDDIANDMVSSIGGVTRRDDTGQGPVQSGSRRAGGPVRDAEAPHTGSHTRAD
jgi:hypothetical protein